MTLKEIAEAVVQHDSSFACKIQRKKNQIIVTCADWPDECSVLLSPYYQQHVADGTFGQKELDGILVEVDRIRKYGM